MEETNPNSSFGFPLFPFICKGWESGIVSKERWKQFESHQESVKKVTLLLNQIVKPFLEWKKLYWGDAGLSTNSMKKT